MPHAKRLGASGVYVAPVGTKVTDGGWKQIGYIDESHEFMPTFSQDLLALQARINKAAHDYSMPSRWAIGVTGPNWWPQSVELPGSTSTPNERSKPVGLTKEYIYKDSGTARKLTIERSTDDPRSVYIHVNDKSNGVGFWLDYADAVPLALNVLGHDRPKLGDWALSSPVVVRGDGHRDELLAQAAANLRAIDLYDQHLVKKKVDEEAATKAAEIAAAKARVEVANREIAERYYHKAKAAYVDAIAAAHYASVTPERAANLQSALSAYETARRKFEGLPS